MHVIQGSRLKATGIDTDAVVARRKIGDVEVTVAVRDHIAIRTRGTVVHQHLGVGHNSPGCIRNRARKGRSVRLGECGVTDAGDA